MIYTNNAFFICRTKNYKFTEKYLQKKNFLNVLYSLKHSMYNFRTHKWILYGNFNYTVDICAFVVISM